MAAIEEIPGINGTNLDLFRAAGILNSRDLLSLSTEELMDRLDEANGDGELVARLPAMAAVEAWRGAAKVFEGHRGEERSHVKLTAGVMKDVRSPGLPVARQMSSKQLREAGIPASAVPIGKLLAEVSAEMEAEEAIAKIGGTSEVAGVAKAEAEKAELVAEESVAAPKEKTAELEPEPEFQQEQNGGREGSTRSEREMRIRELGVREPGSRRGRAESVEFKQFSTDQPAQNRIEKRNHGMLHRDPSSVYFGALATLLAMILATGGFIVFGVALVYALYLEVPVPAPVPWVLLVFPVALILYATQGLRPRCRLCGQQLFRHKSCNKHVKAHRSPFGHIFAVALHALTRGWFRCMLCGTKQRLRD